MITVDADGNALPDGFAGIVERGEQTVVTRLMLDFDGDGYGGVDVLRPDGFGIDRSLSTDLPAQVRLATGYAAAELKADLSAGDPADDSTSAASYFTRGSASPIGAKERIRRPVVADVGYLTEAGPVLVRRFTGLSRALPTSAGRGTAALTALDLRERLRDTVTLIPTDGEQSGADGTWIVFQALYANRIAAGPLPRATGSLLWMPCYGSLNVVTTTRDPAWFAVINAPPAFGTVRPTFQPGPFVLAPDGLYHNTDDDYQRVFTDTFPEGLTWNGVEGRLEMWVLGVPSPTSAPATSKGRVYVAYGDYISPSPRVGVRHNGKLFYDTYDDTETLVNSYETSFIVPGDGGWHFVGVHFDHVGQRIIFRLDSREETVSTAIVAAEIPSLTSIIAVHGWKPFSDLHLHGPIVAAEPWLSQTVQVKAYIDKSALQLVACFEDQPREAWELITEVAAAEQAVVYFDEAGIFRYRTRARLVDTAGQTVQRTLTAMASLVDLDVDDGIDQIRNVIQVSYEPVDISDVFDFVYTDTTRRVVPANSFADFTVSLSDPVVQLQTIAFLFGVAQFEAVGPLDPYLVATLNLDFTDDLGAILAYSAVITTDVPVWTTKAANVRITNGAPASIYVTALGLKGVACRISNRVVAEARNQDSITAWGVQPLQIQASQWVQSSDVGLSLAGALLGDLKQPRRAIGRMTIVGDPRLQLGDRVAIDYPTRPEMDGEYWLTAIADSVDASGAYTQQVAVREATVVLRWGVGRWAENTWGAAG